MQTNSRISEQVLDARRRLVSGREKLQRQHASGTPGIQLCAALTALLDSVILELFESALHDQLGDPEKLRSLLALAAYGGYGRSDVAPYSDVDLILIHEPRQEQELTSFVRKFTQSIYDVGLELGFSSRTPDDACLMATKDISIFTSLAESRFLTGSENLYQRFWERFQRQTRRRSKTLIAEIIKARREERKQYGETNYLLEPHIKRSRGGLRDLQFIRWLGFARCGEVDPDNLMGAGVLSREDHHAIVAAREFLLRLRNELHFHAGKSNDVLTRHEQVRIAELRGCPGSEGVLPVEQFMREYFRHTSEIRYTAANFSADASLHHGFWELLEPLASYRIDGDYRIGPRGIRVVKRRLNEVAKNPAEILRLMDLANLSDCRIEHRTWSAIREAMMKNPTIEVTSLAAEKFLALLSQPLHLGDLLRRLHELRVLEKLVPAVAHARCLLQFNEYHKYTVDEHSIRAIESAANFRSRKDDLGEVYRGIQRKDLLHLALLLHDLGKGFVEDHSDVGRRIAIETAELLNLSEHDRELVAFLVHKHLIMSHLSQWRDINDPQVVVQFAVEIGSPEVLKMLYVLTCADLEAVGPGVLTDWKLRLLTDLYHRTMNHLAGDPASDQLTAFKKQAVRELIPPAAQREWWNRQIEALPPSYLALCEPPRIAAELTRLESLKPKDAIAWHQYLPQQRTVEYTVATHEEIVPGIFHRLTGALTSKGLQILSAEINTLADGLVLDRFYCLDGDYSDEPDAQRMQQVERALVDVLKKPSDTPPTFRKLWTASSQARAAQLSNLPTKVRIDSSTSERFTIIDVFTHDRMGLLYAITRALFELGLSVGVAKIGTHLDQVVDVFYVVDQHGQKITDEPHLDRIRERLLDAIRETESN